MGLPAESVTPPSVPLPRDAFFGRGALLSELEALLAGGERLVTLVGPGGIGKTRLALELCRRVSTGPDRGDGVVFCDLSEAPDALAAADAVARVLGVDAGTVEGPASLGARLASVGRVLLVLDDLERIVDELAPHVGAWLDAAPELRLVATSRERLRLPDELVKEVEPLAVPDARDEAVLRECDAVRLFFARANRRRSLDPRTEVHAVAALVRHLEGIPLAIELAAGRVGALGPAQILAEVERGLDGLGPGDRSRPDRKATLRRTLEGSWAELSDPERVALATLSVFAGGFDADAARAVLGDDGLARVEALHDQSLVRAHAAAALPSPRLSLFEVVRSFAGEHLPDDARADAGRAHARHYAAAADALAAILSARHDAVAAARLAADRENLLVALERGPSLGEHAAAARAGLGLASRLVTTERFAAAHATASRVVEAARASGDEALVVRALELRGEVLRRQDLEGARADLEAAVALARARGLPAPGVHRALGVVVRDLGRFDRAEACFAAAAAGIDAEARPREAATLSLAVSTLRRRQERSEEAVGAAERALSLARAAADGLLEGRALLMLGLLHDDEGALDPAVDSIEQAVTLLRAHGDRWSEEMGQNALGLLYAEKGRADEARAAFEEAEVICTDAGFGAGLACVIGNVGWLAVAAHDLQGAAGQFDRARTKGRAVGHAIAEAQFSAALGAIEALRGRDAAAAEAFADADRAAARCPSPALHRSIDALRAARDVAAARRAAAEGDAAVEARHLATVRAKIAELERAPRLDGDTRIALRLLRRSLDAAPSEPPETLTLSIDAEAAAVRCGDARIALARHPSLFRLVEALVAARGRDAPLDVDALFAAGWPGERIGRRAARNRVHVALSTLRKLGLAGVLVSSDDGYRLAPHVALAG